MFMEIENKLRLLGNDGQIKEFRRLKIEMDVQDGNEKRLLRSAVQLNKIYINILESQNKKGAWKYDNKG